MVGIGLCLVLVGCGSNNKDKIEGTRWSSQEQKAGAKVAPKGAIELRFSGDGNFEWKFGSEAKPIKLKGTYTLGSGDNVTFHFEEEFEERKEHTEKIQVRDKTLTLSDAKGNITFDRVEPK